MSIFKNENEKNYVGGRKHWTDVIAEWEQYGSGGRFDIAFLREVGSHLRTERIAT